MGTFYQTILAAGTLADIQEVLASSGNVAIVAAVAEGRWAVVPKEDDGGYAYTDVLATLLSAGPGGLAASFQVHDSDALTAQLFREGREYRRYLCDQFSPLGIRARLKRLGCK